MHINQNTKHKDMAESADNEYQVCFDGIPLTVPIADKGRADLAYNVLCIMAENDVTMHTKVDGLPMHFTLDSNDISIIDKNMDTVEPELDREWFGTSDDNDKIKEAVLDRYMDDAEQMGKTLDRADEAEKQEQYTICSYDDENCRVQFAPPVWDIEKAAEMQNLFTYGIDSAVSFTMENEFGEEAEIKGSIRIMSVSGDILSDHLNENWAHETVEAISEQDFADAVASIPESGQGMEQ